MKVPFESKDLRSFLERNVSDGLQCFKFNHDAQFRIGVGNYIPPLLSVLKNVKLSVQLSNLQFKDSEFERLIKEGVVKGCPELRILDLSGC